MTDFVPEGFGPEPSTQDAPGIQAQKIGSLVVMGILFADIDLTAKEKDAVAVLSGAGLRAWRRHDNPQKRVEWLSGVFEKIIRLALKLRG